MNKRDQVMALLERYPNAERGTIPWIAEEAGVSRAYVYMVRKEMAQNLESPETRLLKAVGLLATAGSFEAAKEALATVEGVQEALQA